MNRGARLKRKPYERRSLTSKNETRRTQIHYEEYELDVKKRARSSVIKVVHLKGVESKRCNQIHLAASTVKWHKTRK